VDLLGNVEAERAILRARVVGEVRLHDDGLLVQGTRKALEKPPPVRMTRWEALSGMRIVEPVGTCVAPMEVI
jgi:hypothetical protein